MLLDEENYEKAKSILIPLADSVDAEIFLPQAVNDIITFSHLLHHFFIEGVGLRQICDWCRLLWMYIDEIDRDLLEKRLREMRLMNEWKVIATLAVNILGMPVEATPFYEDRKYNKKAQRVLKRVLRTGNFGHNKDASYRTKNSKLIVNGITFGRRLRDFVSLTTVFPIDSPKFFVAFVYNRLMSIAA